MIPDLESLRKLADRVVAKARQAVRPVYVRHAVAWAIASLLFLLAPRLAMTLYFAPAVVLACRYHELAHHRTVRTSKWTFFAIALCAVISVIWMMDQHLRPLEMTLHLALATAVVCAGFHLRSTQQQLAADQEPSARVHGEDDYQPMWACGGLLAGMPVLLLLAAYGGALSWRTPLVLLWGLCALPLLVLQLRTHPAFPRLAILWLAAFFVSEVVCLPASSANSGDDLFLAAAILFFVVPLAGYLAFHPRVKQTFRRAAAPLADALAAKEPGALGSAAAHEPRGQA